MNRRRFLASSSSAVIAAALREWPALAQGRQAKPATKFEELRGGAGIFTGRGGTIGWLVTDDGAVVVDSQFPGTAETCVEGIKRRSRRGIHVLLNTHHHADHTAGNKVFRPAVKFIVAHANSAEWQRTSAVEEKAEANQAYPDQTFTNVWQLKIGKEQVVAKYYGFGHTSGDVVISFETANVVHMGDLVFNRFHPFIDRPAGASIANWITALDRVPREHSADTIYIFGHAKDGFGPTGSRADVTRFRDYLTAVLDYTRKQIAIGKSREEIAKATALPGFEEFAAPDPPQVSLATVLATAYDELKDQ
jgi:glyoxylase-like metal-dependent hydrolase (beta-lactamase superfamily II)